MVKYLEKEKLEDLVKEGIVLVDFYAECLWLTNKLFDYVTDESHDCHHNGNNADNEK